jgi:hypothetical protein
MVLQPRPAALQHSDVIRELVGELATPLRGLLVALASVLLAYLWYDHHRVWAIIIGFAACLAGLIFDGIGKKLLPNRPVIALWFLEGWVLTPAAFAAIGGAVVVLVTVALTVPDTAATSTKETIGALSTGVTAFITASFISWAGDDKDSKVADHIQAAFQAKYGRPGDPRQGVRQFVPESAGELWVHSDEYGTVDGWGGKARRRRAQAIAAELASGASDPPTAGS